MTQKRTDNLTGQFKQKAPDHIQECATFQNKKSYFVCLGINPWTHWYMKHPFTDKEWTMKADIPGFGKLHAGWLYFL